MYKSNCACTGNEEVSVFVKSEICTSEENVSSNEEAEMLCCPSTIPVENEIAEESSCCSSKDKKEEVLSCQSHEGNCECSQPEVTYLKLQNTVLKEEVKFTKVEPVILAVLHTILTPEELLGFNHAENEKPFIDPPPIISSSLDFLIHIQQLKIPSLA